MLSAAKNFLLSICSRFFMVFRMIRDGFFDNLTCESVLPGQEIPQAVFQLFIQA
jgi:hypothetical protein